MGREAALLEKSLMMLRWFADDGEACKDLKERVIELKTVNIPPISE
ncbi:hypothetical protein [Pseudomonas agarici]|nr:hypothetical protein [Pseudomonas agarici]NWB91345.1 hypothetical protein [Pseudomonas agarici]NWC08345.1 hypothetical protein [Pseudomonas agarici]